MVDNSGVLDMRRGENLGWRRGCLGGEKVRGEEGKWNLKELLRIHGHLQGVIE